MPPPRFSTRHSGYLIQSDFGAMGNFELVVPLLGSIAHYWRDNDDAALPWHGPATVGHEPAQPYSSACLIQSNFHYFGGDHGDLEVVMVGETSLDFAWRENGPPFRWRGPTPMLTYTYAPAAEDMGPIARYRANPALIQTQYGDRGDFAVVFPDRDSDSEAIAHYYRPNPDVGPALLWDGPDLFDAGAPVSGVGFLQRSEMPDRDGGGAGDLVCIAARAGSFTYLERVLPYGWEGWPPFPNQRPVATPAPVVGGGTPALIQSDFVESPYGIEGNFELIVPAADGGLAHFWCAAEDVLGHGPWRGPTIFGQAEGVFTSVSMIQSNFMSGGHGNFEVVAFREHEATFCHYWHTNDPPQWNGPNVVDLLNP